MLASVIDYLGDPILVLNVQKFFGVRYCAKETLSVNRNDDPKQFSEKLSPKKNDSGLKQILKINDNSSKISPPNSNLSSENDVSTDSDNDESTCVVTNKFWFYLFLICTSLGDEIFYATFIPFWFWNIDGAVGRRVVLVWTIVMYIGELSYAILNHNLIYDWRLAFSATNYIQ